MRKLFLISLVLVILLNWTNLSSADIINGGFESDLTGWTVIGGIITTPSSYSSDFLPGSLSPFEGQYFLSAKSGGLMEGFATVQQTVHLNAGDVISGKLAYDIGGTAQMKVAVEYNTTETIIWFMAGGPEFSTSWTNWCWTAPETDDFTLRFTAGAMGSLIGDSWATILLDGISVTSYPVPEPSTMILLGSGLVGLVGFRRKFKK